MKALSSAAILLFAIGCSDVAPPAPLPQQPSKVELQRAADQKTTLDQARKEFKTELLQERQSGEPVPEPPSEVLGIVQYTSPVGELAAYLTPPPADGKRRPAIIWITGGDCNTIGDVWQPESPDDDQTASAFREAGIVTMYPSLRGGNENPGYIEGFYGEVDDVLAAADYLTKLDYVDPQRIYLGGQSTGGSLVLLVAACTDRFRAVFSFGPQSHFGGSFVPFFVHNDREWELRSPLLWRHSIRCPTYILEGQRGNRDIHELAKNTNPLIKAYISPDGNHFTILHPLTHVIAKRILADAGEKPAFDFTEAELKVGR